MGNQELLAIKVGLEEWRHWLEGAEQPFLVWADCRNLEYIRTVKCLSARQAGWAPFLNSFDFSLSYCPGSQHVKPDALSHLFDPDPSSRYPTSILPPSCVVGAVTWGIEKKVKQALTNSLIPDGCPQNRLFVPASQDPPLPQAMLGLHVWPATEKGVGEYVDTCPVCAQNKTSQKSPSGLLQPLPVPHHPWFDISLDSVTGFPPSEGNTTILGVVCIDFPRWFILFPCLSCSPPKKWQKLCCFMCFISMVS